MAGIGFAINKIVRDGKINSQLRAFVYASIVAVAPLLLGELVLLAVYALTELSQMLLTDRNMIVSVITYGLLASLLIYGAFSLVISRYLSDQIYEKKIDNMISTYWGSQLCLLVVGGVLYGLFILLSIIFGAGIYNGFLAWFLFCELLLSWNALVFMTVLKDYLGIFRLFLITIGTTFLMGGLFLLLGLSPVHALLSGIIFGYAAFFIQATFLLYKHFPPRINGRRLFDFLAYFDQCYQLAVIGFCSQLGLLGHVIVIWFSPIAQQVKGLFYIAPYYDLTVFIASLTMLATTLSFIVYLEVDFFKSYRQYYLSFSQGAPLQQIKKIEQGMLTGLKNGLRNIAWVQLLVTLVAISIGTILLNVLPLGFNNTMNGYFRILCVAYAMYGMANVISLSTMYFGNVRGNYRASIWFAGTSLLTTALFLRFSSLLYGFGFFIGAAVYFVLTWLDLEKISSQLLYEVLGKQPILLQEGRGFFSQQAELLNRKAASIMERNLHEKR